MPESLKNRLVIAVSSRSLFDLAKSNTIFETQGLDKYTEHQLEHEEVPLDPGVAFPLVKKLLALRYPVTNEPVAEVIIVSKNSPNIGIRIFNSIETHQLSITRAVFTSGRPPYEYLAAFGAHLFLSSEPKDVKQALDHGFAAATLLGNTADVDVMKELDVELRIAFDGDAVLFSDEAEQVYQEGGIEAFHKHEVEKAKIPLHPGPFKPFLEALHKIQQAYAHTHLKPIRTALITARDAPAHKRAIYTLRHWGIEIDEVLFLGGLDKTPFLEHFKPHIFFDDQHGHCDRAEKVVPTGHVPYGIANKKKE